MVCSGVGIFLITVPNPAAFVFLLLGGIFALMILYRLRKPARNVRQPPPRAKPESLGPPPRHLGWRRTVAVLSGPLAHQCAWPFLIGFAWLFLVFEGPGTIGELFRVGRTAQAAGQITAAEAIDHREFGRQFVHYRYQFHAEGQQYTGDSFAPEGTAVGAEVTVYYRPDRPRDSLLAGGRKHQASWWQAAIPLTVVLLLLFGLGAMYRYNIRTVRLLRCGEFAAGELCHSALVEPAQGAPNAPPDPTLRYDYRVEGVLYTALASMGMVSAEHPERATILYDPAQPQRYVIYDQFAERLAPEHAVLFDLLIAPLSMAVLVVMWFWV